MPIEDFFNQLNTGDKVWLVTYTLKIEEDVVLTAAKDKSNRKNLFIHLAKTKLVLSYKDRHYIYGISHLAKLRDVVQTILKSSLVNWEDELKRLMLETNTPMGSPVPYSNS